MSKRSNHYEAAFEAYLRELRAPYIAIDESRRSLIPFDVPSDAVGPSTMRGEPPPHTMRSGPYSLINRLVKGRTLSK